MRPNEAVLIVQSFGDIEDLKPDRKRNSAVSDHLVNPFVQTHNPSVRTITKHMFSILTKKHA